MAVDSPACLSVFSFSLPLPSHWVLWERAASSLAAVKRMAIASSDNNKSQVSAELLCLSCTYSGKPAAGALPLSSTS